jgi:Tfp pilus assembly protein PilF
LDDQGKLGEAMAEHQEALRLRPSCALAHNNLGVVFCKQGKLQAAIAEYRAALRLEPGDAMVHNNLGIALRNQGKLDEAVAEYRQALRFKPTYPEAHVGLGDTLRDQGKLDEAIAEHREALRLNPDHAEAHSRLGVALAYHGKLDEAIAEFRTALRLKPDSVDAHHDFGQTLSIQGKPVEAIAEYREALRLKPDHALAHCNFGRALAQQGRLAEALTELKRGHELGSKNPYWHHPSADWVRETERRVTLEGKLTAILSGAATPSDALERLGLAQLCYDKKLHGASARFWNDAFQAQPKLAEDVQVQNRYNAACAAALAGSGQGKDDPPLDEATKIRWRRQSIDWLKADLAAWAKILDTGPPQVRQAINRTLQHWKADTDLAGLRDSAALANLPDDEQKVCRALWADVDRLSAKSRQLTRP